MVAGEAAPSRSEPRSGRGGASQGSPPEPQRFRNGRLSPGYSLFRAGLAIERDLQIRRFLLVRFTTPSGSSSFGAASSPSSLVTSPPVTVATGSLPLGRVAHFWRIPG